MDIKCIVSLFMHISHCVLTGVFDCQFRPMKSPSYAMHSDSANKFPNLQCIPSNNLCSLARNSEGISKFGIS